MFAAGFTAVAADAIAGQNLLVWRHTSGYLHLWRMDAAWNPTSGFGSQVSGSDDHDATERSFGMDFNGDGNLGSVSGPGNRLLSSGTYRYAYDAEGNRTAKFRDTIAGGTLSIGDTDITLYGYDQRNRLVSVSHVNAWASTQATGLANFTTKGTALPGSDLELRYTYDYADRRIRRSLDGDGAAGTSQESVSFAAYAVGERTLQISRPSDRIVTDSATGKVWGFLGQVVDRLLRPRRGRQPDLCPATLPVVR